MPSSVRIGLVAALAIACHGAVAQTTAPPAITVQRIAPQLVQFAGSQANFQNLVIGLTQGTQVQLFTVLADGTTQITTFTPAAPLATDQIAQVLERARQQLIGLGIANPTGEQLAAALMGGTVPTALGGTQVTGLLDAGARPPAAAVQAQTSAAAGATGATTSTSIPASPVNVQLVPGVTTAVTPTAGSAAPRFNTSDSPLPAGVTSRSPTPPTAVVTPAANPTPLPQAPRGTESSAPAPAQPRPDAGRAPSAAAAR